MFNSTDYIGILNTRIEMGFMTYLKILHGISDDPGIMLFTSSIICVGPACLFTYQFSKNCVMSMMLYILMGSYFGQMNTMRQAIALSISEVAFMLVISNRGVRRKTCFRDSPFIGNINAYDCCRGIYSICACST